MKKTVSIILIATLAVTSVIGASAAMSKRLPKDVVTSESAYTQLETSPSATEKIAETQKPTEAKTEKAAKKTAEAKKTTKKKATKKTDAKKTDAKKADAKKADATKTASTKKAVAEKTSTAKTNEQKTIEYHDSLNNVSVMPDLIGLWGNIENGGYCVRIVNQDGNNIDLVIESTNENHTHIATAEISVTLDTSYDENGIVGTADFNYYDSFGSGGRGSITISGDTLDLTINEEFNPCADWSIGNGTGTYVRV